MRYQPGAIGFRIGHSGSVMNAWYRIDNGLAIRWQDAIPALISAGAQIDGPALDDPTGGILWLPIAEVLPARSVAIRTHDRGRISVFHPQGLAAALDAAHSMGCTSDAAFVS